MSDYIDNAQDLADELNVPLATVERWADDLHIVAEKCLQNLSSELQKKAMWYLVAYTIQQSEKEVLSESVDNASRSFSGTQKDMVLNPYGRMAVQIAPCLAKLGTKQYTARLLA